MAPAHRIAAAVVAAFLIGSLANVAIETFTPASFRALRAHTAGDLATLAVETQNTVRVKYAFPAALHDVARGGVLVVADPKPLGLAEIENLALMTVSVEEFDPAIRGRLAADLLQLADRQGSGALSKDGEETTFAIVADEPVTAGTRFRLVFFQDAALVVDERILERVQR